MMGLKDYTDFENTSRRNQILKKFEPYINAIFYLECSIKIIAMGFLCGKNSYLRNGWNVLDFFVVLGSFIASLAQYFSPNINSSGIRALRTFRILRPLRLLGRVQTLRGIVITLINSITAIYASFGLLFFVFIVYAIFGMTVWNGSLHYRCYTTDHPVDGVWILHGAPDNTYTDICSDNSPCPEGAFCRNRFLEKDPDNADAPYPFIDSNDLWVDSLMEEQNWGYNNFDNFGSAMLTVFQVTTTDGWTPIMFNYENAGSQILSWFYFISCVIVCNFFIMNLTVGQMLLFYQEQMQNEEKNRTELDSFQKELEAYAKTKLPKQFSEGQQNIIRYILSINDIKISKSCLANSDLKIQKSLFQSFADAQKISMHEGHDGLECQDDQKIKNAIISGSPSTAFEGDVLFEDKETQVQLTLLASTVYTKDSDTLKRRNKSKLVIFCKDIVEDIKFNAFVLLIIFANTVVLCCDKYPEYPDQVLNVFQKLNWLFTFVFTFELVAKMIAMGLGPYFKDYFNIFDALIVVASIQDIYISDIKSQVEGNNQVLILRTFRCFRLFKLFKFGDLKVLVDSQLRTLPMFLPFLLLLILMFYIFALIGMSFFAGKIKIDDNGHLSQDDADLVREGYDNLGMAMITIFQVLMGAEWRFIWYKNMTASGPFAAFYYVAIHLLLGTVMINLLIAIMLGNYEKARNFQEKRKIFDAFQVLCLGTEYTNNVNLFKASSMETWVVNQTMSKIVEVVLDAEYANHINNEIINKKEGTQQAIEFLQKLLKKKGKNYQSQKVETQTFDLDNGYFANSSLGIFHIDSQIRQWCLKLCINEVNLQKLYLKRPIKDLNKSTLNMSQGKTSNYNNQFEKAVLSLIIINSIQLAFSKGELTDKDTNLYRFFKVTNIVFTFLFAAECAIKIIGLGFYKNQLFHIDPYIRSGWNKLDFIIVTSSLIDVFLLIAIEMRWADSKGNFAAMKSLRALRALRPLRAIQRFPVLKQVVTAFLNTFLAVQNVFFVYILQLIIFGVIGVSLMKGTFGSCDDSTITTQAECPEGQWQVNNSNFDNIIQALKTLFIMTTTEGWSGVMYLGVDSAGQGKASITNNSPYIIWYFIIFMTTGSLFIVTLLVGVVIDQYNKNKIQQEHEEQAQDVKIKATLAVNELNSQKSKQIKYIEPDNWRLHAFRLTHHSYFGNFIIVVVMANTITMAMNSYQSKMQDILKIFNLSFTIIFNLEMILKLISDLDKYFISNWNRLDLIIVVSADINILLDIMFENSHSTMAKEAIKVFRVFRVLRVAKLLHSFQNIQILIKSLIQITQGIGNVLLLLALVIYIYALLGINMFAGEMRLAELDKYNNFDSFGRAFLSLLRYSTGEDFQEFMYEYTNSGNGCLHDGVGEGKFNYDTYVRLGNVRCGTNLAIPYFVSFIVIASWMVLNLVIATIVDGLASASFDHRKIISKEVIEMYLEIWINYDPNMTWELDMENDSVWKFLAELPDPLSESKKSTLKQEWNPEKEELSDKFIYHYDNKYSQHFKVRKFSILKFMNKTKVKFHKRENGTLYIKFEEFAFEWMSKHITDDNKSQMFGYKDSVETQPKPVKNDEKIDAVNSPQHTLAREILHEHLTILLVDYKQRKIMRQLQKGLITNWKDKVQ